jgi:hypothetical protein
LSVGEGARDDSTSELAWRDSLTGKEITSMFCTRCGAFVAPGWNVCSNCHAPVSVRASIPVPPPHAAHHVPHIPADAPRFVGNVALRERLLTFMLEDLTSPGLSDWLRNLDADTRGTVEEKKQRIRQRSKFLREPPLTMIAEAMADFCDSSPGAVAKLCEELGIPSNASKQGLLRRLHRFVATQEGLLPPRPHSGPWPTVHEVYPFVAWYPVYKGKNYERQFYAEFRETMTDIFGEALVHEQMPVAHGTTLKIDFHIGSAVPPGQGGVGIEFKMPTSNSEVQKAIGQLGQYQVRYGQSLIVVVFPDFLEQRILVPFFHELTGRGIAHVVKREFWEEAEE